MYDLQQKDTNTKDISKVQVTRGLTLSSREDIRDLLLVKGRNLVRAAYYVTRFFREGDLLREKLRSVAHELVDTLLRFLEEGRREHEDRIHLHREKFKLYLFLSHEEGYLEQGHLELFFREIESFRELLPLWRERVKERESVLIPDINELLGTYLGGEEGADAKSPLSQTQKERRKVRGVKEKNASTGVRMSTRKDSLRKEERKRKILAFLEEGGEHPLPDICLLFESCSPKTIQRDLQELIRSGLVEKVGERRWTRYRKA
jgi:hypothetical protein